MPREESELDMNFDFAGNAKRAAENRNGLVGKTIQHIREPHGPVRFKVESDEPAGKTYPEGSRVLKGTVIEGVTINRLFGHTKKVDETGNSYMTYISAENYRQALKDGFFRTIAM